METGWINSTCMDGGRIRIHSSGERIGFRWRDCAFRPNEVGHGTQVMFHVIIERGKRSAIGVQLRPLRHAG